MKLFFCALLNLVFILQLTKAASVPRERQNEGGRVKREDDNMFAAIAQGGVGMVAMGMDAFSKGGAAKDERDFQADIPFASVKGHQKHEIGHGDAMANQDGRRKRSPCGKKKNDVTTTTIEPPAEDLAARRKRQAVNDPDNVRPKIDGKTAMQSFIDSFVELAKKIGNLFVPSDPNNRQTRQQEMDDRY